MSIPKKGTMDWHRYKGLKETVDEANNAGGKTFTEIAYTLEMSIGWVSEHIKKWGITYIEPKTKERLEMEQVLSQVVKDCIKYGIEPPDITKAVLPSQQRKFTPETITPATATAHTEELEEKTVLSEAEVMVTNHTNKL